MEDNHLYEVNLEWTNDRKGLISSPVLPGNIEVATPPEFPKGIPGIWSPEHLYVGAVVTCFMTTFLAIAENSKLEFNAFSCDAKGLLAKVDGKFQMTEITLYPTVTLLNEEQAEKATRIMDMSERNCLISNSIKTTVLLDPAIVTSSVQPV
jgi:peroxiredoxin-like protein